MMEANKSAVPVKSTLSMVVPRLGKSLAQPDVECSHVNYVANSRRRKS
jgi:hypothetical protein